MPSHPSDIVVVGAGIVGCAVAYELARRGVSVEVVDDRAPGMGATQASAGVLAPYIEANQGGALLDLTARSLDLYDDFVARAASYSGAGVLYRRTGTLDVVFDEDGLRKLRATAALLASRGVAGELVDGPASRAEEPHLAADVTG